MPATVLKNFLKITNHSNSVEYKIHRDDTFEGYRRLLIDYPDGGENKIPAYLFVPTSSGKHPAVLIHHQHNGERHFGKSEVAGLVGDQFQAFGPELAKRGFVVLAPDSICFEDRRKNKIGTEPDVGDGDWLQHFNELTYRLVKGDSLMRKVLDDASIGISLIENLPFVDSSRLGVLGHSYGGNTTLFQAAIDERVKFACSSGAVCSYAYKMANEIPFEFALTIPGFCESFDFVNLLELVAPRDFLVISATDDKYSKDAAEVVRAARPAYERLGAKSKLSHKLFAGNHSLTKERFDLIIDWIIAR